MKAIFSHSSCLSKQSVSNYVNGRLSPEKRFEVENHLLDCALCRAAVEGYALTREEAPNISVGPTPRKSPRRRKALLLLCVIGAAAAALWYAQSQRAQQPEILYTRFFAPAANTFLVQGRNAATEPAHAERGIAMDYYDEGRYAAALPHFSRYLEQHSQDGEALLYFGITQLSLRQLPEAAKSLSEAAELVPERNAEATWYLALAQLRNGDTETAKKILRPLLETQGAYRQKAEDLLRDLEKLD
jgi:tetratricopeptide (TPR) repeat protein